MAFIADTFYLPNKPKTYTIADIPTVSYDDVPAETLALVEDDNGGGCDLLGGDFDGYKWADEFIRIFHKNDGKMDRDWVMGWMVNAFMKGWDTYSQRHDIDQLQMDAEPTNNTFEIGDIVTLNQDIHDSYIDIDVKAGTICKVMDINNDWEYPYELRTQNEDQDEFCVLASEISLYTIPVSCEEMPEKIMSIGDNVKITFGCNEGKTGTIMEMDEIDGRYRIQILETDGIKLLWYMGYELEPMPIEIVNTDTAELDEIIPF